MLRKFQICLLTIITKYAVFCKLNLKQNKCKIDQQKVSLLALFQRRYNDKLPKH